MSIRIIEISREIPPEGKKSAMPVEHGSGIWRAARENVAELPAENARPAPPLFAGFARLYPLALALRGNFAGQRLQFFPRKAREARDLIHGQLP